MSDKRLKNIARLKIKHSHKTRGKRGPEAKSIDKVMSLKPDKQSAPRALRFNEQCRYSMRGHHDPGMKEDIKELQSKKLYLSHTAHEDIFIPSQKIMSQKPMRLES